MTDTLGLFAPQGRIDNTSSAAREREVTALLESGKTSLLIDLSEVSYLSSAGLRVLLIAAKGCKSKGGRAVLAGASGPVLDVIRMSGFDRLMSIAADRDAGWAALTQAS